MSIKTRVRVTTETVVDDTDIQQQRYRDRRVRKVTHQINIPEMSTPAFSHVLLRLDMFVRKGQQKFDTILDFFCLFVYYESIKRGLKRSTRRLI